MVKRRPVVIVSPRRRRGPEIYTVVPLSTTAPSPVEPFHHQMDPDSLPGPLAGRITWAKCDMLYTLSLRRLDRIMVSKDSSGKRNYAVGSVIPADWRAIQRAILAGLDLQAPL
jgi:mRNA interferase MazF